MLEFTLVFVTFATIGVNVLLNEASRLNSPALIFNRASIHILDCSRNGFASPGTRRRAYNISTANIILASFTFAGTGLLNGE